MKQRNILIVSASAGTGHVRAADALQSAMRSARPDWNVVHVDVLELAPRWVRAAYGGGFELVAAHAPRVWRGIYRLADGPAADRARWGGTARRVLFRSFGELMRATHWDHVVCTHFLPAQLAARRTAGAPPYMMVVTDFTLHRYWVQPGVTSFCVATAGLAAQVRARLARASVEVTGIPVDTKFESLIDRQTARTQLGLNPDAPIALVIGGGLGIGVVEAARDCLTATRKDVQLVAICGRNESAADQLRSLGLPPQRLAVCGYVADIDSFFAAADVIVTKPGGLTCSEALAACKPLVLTRPIPGHEEGNVDYLTKVGAALNGETSAQLVHSMQAVFTQPGLLERLSAAVATLAQPRAARAVAQLLLGNVEREVAA